MQMIGIGGHLAMQLARDQRAEFQHPAPHRFIGDVKPTLGEHFLHISDTRRSNKPCAPLPCGGSGFLDSGIS